MQLKMTTLIENIPDYKNELAYEHGFSLYIECNGKRILFDTGQTGAFIDNAVKLDKDLEMIDAMVISHGHYDHSGGLNKFLQTIPYKKKLYVGKEFFFPKYKKLEDGTFKFNGNAFSEQEIREKGIQLIKVEEKITYITPEILLFKNFQRTNGFEKINDKFYVEKDGIMACDSFDDEIVLGIVTDKGLVVAAGCAHAGIVNILEEITHRVDIPIYAVIGGTHLVTADENRIDETIAVLKKMEIKEVAVSHCTGLVGMKKLEEAFNEHYIKNNTGNIYTL